ncbi:uncharacterized protein A1O9_13147, partial [Exophiala aquamarina CBS 119918]
EDEADEDPPPEDGDLVPRPSLFQPVKVKPLLPSTKSMLTLALHNFEKCRGRAHSLPAPLHWPLPCSPSVGSSAASPEDGDDGTVTQTSRGAPITTPPPRPPAQSAAYSPQTIRRKMLSEECTESLRKDILWERQEKSQAFNAFLKRRRRHQD